MKFMVETTISLPVNRVVELFDNTKNLKKWMKRLESFEPISGTPGQPGAKSRLRFKMGGREIEMVETVTVRDLPHEFAGTYEARGVWSETRILFEDLGDGKTKLVSRNEFRLGWFMKVIGWLMPGMIKKQSIQHLEAFKMFAESEAAKH
ncbi:MAG: SRPBCC family protein [Dehalococcoidia bacterium]|nr:SRPBCC family protein [Dehalococcoidia bacterium]